MPNNKTITPVGIWSQHGAFLTVTDLMEILKLSRGIVDRMLKTGQLPAAKIGG